MAVQKESEIKITVGLDENRIPETISLGRHPTAG